MHTRKTAIHLTQGSAIGQDRCGMENDLSAAAELAKRFATEAACRDYLIQLRWPDGFRCPQCGGRASWRLNNARFECRACGRQTSATAGTIFEGTRKPLRLWFRAMECVTSRRQGASTRALQGLLRLPSYQTARFAKATVNAWRVTLDERRLGSSSHQMIVTGKGCPTASEAVASTDSTTGITIHRLTSHSSISHPSYFLQRSFLPGDLSVFFVSYRTGRPSCSAIRRSTADAAGADIRHLSSLQVPAD